MPNTVLLTHQQRQRTDPTGTGGIRRRYEADIRRRFGRLRSDIWQSVMVNDALALREQPSIFEPLPRRAFEFATDPEKIAFFRQWLRRQIDEDILEVIARNLDGTVEAATGWQDLYVRAAYGKGVTDAQVSLAGQGLAPPSIELEGLLRGPVHAPRLELLFVRNFTELEGITAAMDQALSRLLAEGLSQGDGPRTIARALVNQVGLSSDRARLMARTEVIRAHAEGTLTELERSGITGVQVQVEFATAGDIRVCTRCLAIEARGRIYPIDEARGIIPVHPRCRCRWLPAGFSEDPGQRRRRSERARRRIRELETSPRARREQREASRGAA